MRFLLPIIISLGILIGIQFCQSPTASTQRFDNVEVLYIQRHSGTTTLGTVQPGMTPTVILQNGALNYEAHYVQHDSSIIFTSTQGTTEIVYNLYLLPRTGGIPQQLTAFSESVYDLHFTPNEENIVFQVNPAAPSIWWYHLPTETLICLQEHGILLDIGPTGRILFVTPQTTIDAEAKWMSLYGGAVHDLPITLSDDAGFYQNEDQILYTQSGYDANGAYAKAQLFQVTDSSRTEFTALSHCSQILAIGPQGHSIVYRTTDYHSAIPFEKGVSIFVAPPGRVQEMDPNSPWEGTPQFTTNGDLFVYTTTEGQGESRTSIHLWDVPQQARMQVMNGVLLYHSDIRVIE